MCKILDVRSGQAVAQVGGGHSSSVNSLAWATAAASMSDDDEPCGQTHACEHQMLSASFDAAMYVHDIRRPDVPLLGLTGHTVLPKAKSLHQASFTWGMLLLGEVFVCSSLESCINVRWISVSTSAVTRPLLCWQGGWVVAIPAWVAVH